MNRSKRTTIYDNLYLLIFPVITAICIGGAVYVKNYRLPEKTFVSSVLRVANAEFLITEPKKKVVEIPIVKNVEKREEVVEEKKEIIDLSEKPDLNQEKDEVAQKKTDEPIVKKVYGLGKVYSAGIGNSGNLSDAVIGKLGNTIATSVDTVTATEKEIKGQIVSTTTVTSSPQFVKIVKPEYSKEMLDNKAEGVVKVKALVDIDGKVKKAMLLNDLGFNTGNAALKATLEMLFTPAKRGDEPVAVWIVIPVRFVMLS